MPEDGPFGDTFFEARLRAIVAASFLKSPSCGYVDSVFTPADHFRLPCELRCAAPLVAVLPVPLVFFFADVFFAAALFVDARFVPVRLVLAVVGISPSFPSDANKPRLINPEGCLSSFLFPSVDSHSQLGNARQFATVSMDIAKIAAGVAIPRAPLRGHKNTHLQTDAIGELEIP
jgi:hypothetical protein